MREKNVYILTEVLSGTMARNMTDSDWLWCVGLIFSSMNDMTTHLEQSW